MKMEMFMAVNGVTGAAFAVRHVKPGDRYGREGCLISDADLIEFYDTRYPHTELGQFVSRYYLETLLGHGERALCLDGGISAWSVTSGGMAALAKKLEKINEESSLRSE